MGNGTGVATFVANAAGVTVSDTLSVAQFNQLDARAGGTIAFTTLTDTASALASAVAANAIAAKPTTISVAPAGTGVNANDNNATVAEATILVARGITGFTISDTAAAISAASPTLLANAAAQFIVVNDGGVLTLGVDSALKVLDRASGSANAGNPDGNASVTYDLVDSAAKLAGADADLIGFARNVTANTVANLSQAETLSGRTSMGTINYSVTVEATDDLTTDPALRALNSAINITASDAQTLADARILNDATNSGTTSYAISDTAGALALVNNTTNAANIAAINAATGTVTVTDAATGLQASQLAAYTKPVVFSVSDTPTGLVASTGLGEAVNIVSTGATATTMQAATIMAAANTGTTTISAVSGTATQVLALALGANDKITTLNVTGTASIIDAAAINAKDTGANIGAVTFVTVTGSAADVLANVATANLAATVVVTGVVSVAQAVLLRAAEIADGDTDYTYSISDTYANLMENSDAIVSGTGFEVDANAALVGATRITVTDAMTIAQAQKLATVGPNTLAVEADVFTIVDTDANIAAAMTNNVALLTKAASVTLANGTVVKFDDIGGTLHIVGTRAEIEALPATLAAANKIMEVSVADLAANPGYFASLPSVVDYRVVDTFANLTSGNALIGGADGITVTDNITMAQAVTARALGLSVGEVSYSLRDQAALLVAGSTANVDGGGVVTGTTLAAVLNDAVSVEATTPVTVEQAAMLRAAAGATGTATYSISVADTAVTLVSGNAAILDGATNITVTATTGGSITHTEAAVLLGATNSGTTTIARISGAATDVAELIKGANDTITSIVTTGTATVAEARILQGLSSSVTYSLQDTAANLVAAGDAVLNGATQISLVTTGTSTTATLAQLAIIDAATNTGSTTVAVADTAANILAASPALLARANGAITVLDTSITAGVATQLRALDASTNTFAITVTNPITDTSANLILAANVAAVDAAPTVNVTDVVSVTRAAQVLTATGGATGVKFDVSDTYSNIVLNSAVSAAGNSFTITNAISAQQARTADSWGASGGAKLTFSVNDTAANVANTATANVAALAQAASITVRDAASVAQAAVLSDMANVVRYTIQDDAATVAAALNTLNGANAADRNTVLEAASITLLTAATVDQAAGVAGSAGNGEKLGLVAVPGLAFRVSDTAASIVAALKDPARSAAVLNATTVALSSNAGATIADLNFLNDLLGPQFINHDHDTNAATAARYYITDSVANILAADQTFVEGAFSVVANGTDGSDVIDFSGFARGSTINGGLGDDTITGGAGADVMTGGAGADIFRFAAGDTGTPSATNFDRITDFGAGDVIDYTVAITIQAGGSGAAGQATISGQGIATFDNADDTLAERIAAVQAAMAATGGEVLGEAAAFMFEGNAYMFIEDGQIGLSADDVLIRLDGVNLADPLFNEMVVNGSGNVTFA